MCLHAYPGGATGAGDINPGHACGLQAGDQLRRHAAARLLHDDGSAEFGGEAGDGIEAAAEVAVAIVLDDFLRRVEVDAERVCIDGADEVLQLGRGAGCGLHGSDVAEQERGGCDIAHRIGAERGRVSEHRSLGADAEADAKPLCRGSEAAVDVACAVCAARHSGDEERCAELLAGVGAAEVNCAVIKLRQAVVEQCELVEQRRLFACFHLRRCTEGEVVEFTLRERRVVGDRHGSRRAGGPSWMQGV